MKKMSFALAVLALVLGTSVLYSGTGNSGGVGVQLPNEKIGQFELNTVADGKGCFCKINQRAITGQILHVVWSGLIHNFPSADSCENHCEKKCQDRFPNDYRGESDCK